MTSRDYKLGYSRGYNARSNNRWPEHIPPVPPDPIIGKLVTALQRLRDGVDGELAKFDPEDDIEIALAPLIDEATEALMAVGEYARAIQDED